MHPTIGYELAKTRIADLHRQAERDRAARAAIQASRARQEHGKNREPGRTPGVLARRALTMLGARSA